MEGWIQLYFCKRLSEQLPGPSAPGVKRFKRRRWKGSEEWRSVGASTFDYDELIIMISGVGTGWNWTLYMNS